MSGWHLPRVDPGGTGETVNLWAKLARQHGFHLGMAFSVPVGRQLIARG